MIFHQNQVKTKIFISAIFFKNDFFKHFSSNFGEKNSFWPGVRGEVTHLTPVCQVKVVPGGFFCFFSRYWNFLKKKHTCKGTCKMTENLKYLQDTCKIPVRVVQRWPEYRFLIRTDFKITTFWSSLNNTRSSTTVNLLHMPAIKTYLRSINSHQNILKVAETDVFDKNWWESELVIVYIIYWKHCMAAEVVLIQFLLDSDKQISYGPKLMEG